MAVAPRWSRPRACPRGDGGPRPAAFSSAVGPASRAFIDAVAGSVVFATPARRRRASRRAGSTAGEWSFAAADGDTTETPTRTASTSGAGHGDRGRGLRDDRRTSRRRRAGRHCDNDGRRGDQKERKQAAEAGGGATGHRAPRVWMGRIDLRRRSHTPARRARLASQYHRPHQSALLPQQSPYSTWSRRLKLSPSRRATCTGSRLRGARLPTPSACALGANDIVVHDSERPRRRLRCATIGTPRRARMPRSRVEAAKYASTRFGHQATGRISDLATTTRPLSRSPALAAPRAVAALRATASPPARPAPCPAVRGSPPPTAAGRSAGSSRHRCGGKARADLEVPRRSRAARRSIPMELPGARPGWSPPLALMAVPGTAMVSTPDVLRVDGRGPRRCRVLHQQRPATGEAGSQVAESYDPASEARRTPRSAPPRSMPLCDVGQASLVAGLEAEVAAVRCRARAAASSSTLTSSEVAARWRKLLARSRFELLARRSRIEGARRVRD